MDKEQIKLQIHDIINEMQDLKTMMKQERGICVGAEPLSARYEIALANIAICIHVKDELLSKLKKELITEKRKKYKITGD